MNELKAIKETMHSVELKLPEKDENIGNLVNICEKHDKKCNKIPDLQKEVKEMRDIINTIKVPENVHAAEIFKETENIRTQIAEVRQDIMSVKSKQTADNSSREQTQTPTKTDKEYNFETPRDNKGTRNERSDKQEIENVGQNSKIWIMGTSIVKDLDGRKIYRNRNTRITTLRDKTVHGGKEFIKEMRIHRDTSVIMVQVGSNDLGDKDAGEVIDQYEELIDQIRRQSYPDSEVVLGQILPRYT